MTICFLRVFYALTATILPHSSSQINIVIFFFFYLLLHLFCMHLPSRVTAEHFSTSAVFCVNLASNKLTLHINRMCGHEPAPERHDRSSTVHLFKFRNILMLFMLLLTTMCFCLPLCLMSLQFLSLHIFVFHPLSWSHSRMYNSQRPHFF